MIHAWDAAGWNVDKFVLEYNAGNIAANLRAEHGGCGASLDKRTKDLIWFYYLHKKQTFGSAGDSDAGRYESYISIDYTRCHAMEMVVYDHKALDFASRIKRADGWHRARWY